ncbi:hypothetical protein Tco_1494344, partial [Tanacetum coccineum]
ETDIQEKEQKESQKQSNPSTEWKGQSRKSSQVKKIQLEGLKLPKPQDVLQKRKTRVKIAKKVEIAFKLYNLRGPNCQLTLKPSFPPQNPVTTVTTNHDVCVLNYVNDMNSRADNQSANVSKHENQKKHKANARKSKELGPKEVLLHLG